MRKEDIAVHVDAADNDELPAKALLRRCGGTAAWQDLYHLFIICGCIFGTDAQLLQKIAAYLRRISRPVHPGHGDSGSFLVSFFHAAEAGQRDILRHAQPVAAQHFPYQDGRFKVGAEDGCTFLGQPERQGVFEDLGGEDCSCLLMRFPEGLLIPLLPETGTVPGKAENVMMPECEQVFGHAVSCLFFD